jgi:hypothetical protein
MSFDGAEHSQGFDSPHAVCGRHGPWVTELNRQNHGSKGCIDVRSGAKSNTCPSA